MILIFDFFAVTFFFSSLFFFFLIQPTFRFPHLDFFSFFLSGEQHSFPPPRPQDPTIRKQRAENALWGNALRDDFGGGGGRGGGGRGSGRGSYSGSSGRGGGRGGGRSSSR